MPIADRVAVWCSHPPEEMIRLYRGPAEVYADRRLCGICAEIVYLSEERLPAGRAPAARGTASRRDVRGRSVP